MRRLAAMLMGVCGASAWSCGAHGPVVDTTKDASTPVAPVFVCAPLQPTDGPHDAFGDACSFSGGSVPTLVAVVGKTLVTIDHAGVIHTVHTFFGDAPDIVPYSYPAVIHRGAYIAAAEMGSSKTRSRFEIVIVGLDGTVLAQRAEDMGGGGPTVFSLAGSDAGLFAYQWDFGGVDPVVGLITSTGVVGSVPDIELATDIGDDAFVGVFKTPHGAMTDPVYWLDTCAGTMTRSHEPDFNIYIQPEDGAYALGNRILYLDRAASALVDEGPHDVRSLVIDNIDTPPNSTRIQAIEPDGWVLFAGPAWLAPWITANVSAGTTHVLTGTLPPTFKLLNPPDALPGPAINVSGGDVTVPLRDTTAGELFVDSDNTWQTLGLPIGDVYWANAMGWAGTYLFEGHWQDNPAALQYETWPAPQGARLDGSSLQLLNPAHATSVIVEHVAPPQTFGRIWHLSHDGACLSYFDGGVIRVVSAATGAGAAFDLSAFAQPDGVVASTFVQGDDLGME